MALVPPANEAPLTDSGQHTQAWGAFHEDVARMLSTVHQGVTDGSDAKAGDVGEYLSGSSGSVSLTSAAAANIASLDLTAGDWDVSGSVSFSAGSGTHNYFAAGIGGIDTLSQATFPSTPLVPQLITATRRYNVTATTTVWVVAQAGFTGTVSATGSIRARRAR